MEKQKDNGATALVAKLNRQFKDYQLNLRSIKTAADTENDYEFLAAQERGYELNAAFEKTMAELKALGETVKFDDAREEYFLGARTFRIKFTCVSEGFVEIEAPNEQIALMKAEKLADYDEIDLLQVSGKLESVTENA